MQKSEFPTSKIPDIQAAPADYRLLQRIPATMPQATFPVECNAPVGDEQVIVIVDVETTGLRTDIDSIIELGIVRASYSPSAKRITAILDAFSRYDDPQRPIPSVITELTGISGEDVAGHQIDNEWVAAMVEDDPIVLAHNAAFDRAFVEARFPSCQNQRWGCTANDIPWKDFGIGSRKLDYLLLQHGWFFDGHRASVDCLATAWLLVQRPDAFAHLLDSVNQRSVTISAHGAPFAVKDKLKERGYRWYAGTSQRKKCWWREVKEPALEDEKATLDALYPRGAELAAYEYRDARTRHQKK